MKTRNVVILVIIASAVSIAFTYLIISALHTDQQRKQQEEAVLKKETAPALPTAVSPQPAVDKAKILALFDIRTQEQKNEVIESFKKVMRDAPPYIITGTKGYPDALNGQYEKAAQITQDEIRENPVVADPRYTLAWIYAKTGNYDKALAVCDDALQNGPVFNKLRYIKAWVYAKQGKFDDALKTCDEALRDDPYSAMLYYAKGRIQDLSGHSDDAIASYSRAISLKSDFVDAYVFQGLIYTQLGRYDDAIKAQKQAISLNRYSPAAYIGLGLVYELTGNYQPAVEQFNNAITIGSFGTNSDSANQPLTLIFGIDNAIIYNRIGVLDARLGSYQDALTAFNNAIAARIDFPEAYRGLTLTYLLLGDKESALKNYEKLKNLSADLAKSVAPIIDPNK